MKPRPVDIIETSDYIDADVMRVLYVNAAVVLVAAMVLPGRLRLYQKYVLSRPMVWTTLFISYCGITALWSERPLITIYETGLLAITLILIIYLAYEGRKRMNVYSIGFILLIPYVIAFMYKATEYPGSLPNPYTYKDANVGAGCAVVFCMVIGHILSIRDMKERKPWKTASIMGLAVAFFRSAASIGASIGTFVTLAWQRRRIGLVLFAIMIVLCIFVITEADILKTFSLFLGGKSVEKVASFTGRLDVWPAMIDYGFQRPFSGYGAGSVNRLIYQELRYRNERNFKNTHNAYLSAFLSGGLPLLLLMLISLVDAHILWLKKSSSSLDSEHPEMRSLALQIGAATIAITLLNITNNAIGATAFHSVWSQWCLVNFAAVSINLRK